MEVKLKLLIIGIALIAAGIWLIKKPGNTTTLWGVALMLLGIIPFVGVIAAVISFVLQLVMLAILLVVVLAGIYWLKNRNAQEPV